LKLLSRLLPRKLKVKLKSSLRFMYYYELIYRFKKTFEFHLSKKNISNVVNRIDFSNAYDRECFEFYSIINQPLKWGYSSLDYRAIYSGSSDKLLFEGLFNSNVLRQITDNNECILISVIGGGYFFEIIKNYRFSEVVLFDSNINEHAKVSSIVNQFYIKGFSMDEFENLLIQDKKSLMPYLEYSRLQYKLTNKCVIKYPEKELEESPEGLISEKGFPIMELSQNFPERKSIIFNKDETNMLISKLESNLDSSIYNDYPKFNANGKVVIVFLSNISRLDLSDEDVRLRTSNASGTFILRDNYHRASSNLQDPHQHWSVEVYKEIRKLAVIRIVASNKFKKDSSDNWMFQNTVTINELKRYPVNSNTILLHILIGHSRQPSMVRRNLTNLTNRLKVVTKIIVTEHSHTINKKNSFSSNDSIISFYENIFNGFELKSLRFIQGNNDPNRNILLVFESQ
jgi:hypothetical protein